LGVLLKAGNSQGTHFDAVPYSTDKEVEDLIDESASVAEFKKQLLSQNKRDLDTEIAFLQDSPFIDPTDLENVHFDRPLRDSDIPHLSRTEILIERTGSGWSGEVLLVQPQSDVIQDSPVKYRYWSHALLPWAPIYDPEITFSLQRGGLLTFPPSVLIFAHPVSYLRPDSWVKEHPRKALQEIFKIAHDEDPISIGPPYAIMHLIGGNGRQPKIRWAQKGACESWNSEIESQSWLEMERDGDR
jgi:hypothetical protein